MTRHAQRSLITRRHLLLGATAAALSGLAAACGSGSGATDTPKPAAPTVAPAATPIVPSPTAAPVMTATPTTAPTAAATAAPVPTATTAPTAIATLAATAPSSTVAPVEAGDLIKDPAGHFTFTGPKGWAANPDPSSPIVVQLRAENPFRGLNVRESAPTEGKTLEQFAKETLTVLKKSAGFRTGTRELQPTTLGGEPAIIDDFVTAGNGTLGYNVRVLCIRQNLLYTVGFGTDPQNADALQPVVKLVLDTWKFL